MTQEIPIRCYMASAVVLEDGPTQPKMLLLRRASEYLNGEWCHVAGKLETGETAGQAVLREIREETGLSVSRLFSADFCEQFYETHKNAICIVPAFVAYVDADQEVQLNEEHDTCRWVLLAEAAELVPFGGQRKLYAEIQREFIDREPCSWLEIDIR